MTSLIRFDPKVGELTTIGLALQPGLSFERWEETGAWLKQVESGHQWWRGDWLNYGERGYGENYAQAVDDTDYQRDADYKWVAGAIELSDRSESLSWTHHRFIAELSTREQRLALIKEAEENSLSVREVRERVNALKRGISKPVPLPPGKFSLIYADPPWRYEHFKTDSRRIENQYPTMELDEIRALSVADLAADDCVLFLWATSPKLAEAISVIDAWGFVYRTCAVWDKEVIGMGYYFRQQHELLLVATRGEPAAPDESVRESSVIHSRRGEHSAKPVQVYELLERMYPSAGRIELFARAARPGWSGWGNQIAA